MPGPVFTNNASGTLASNYSAAATAITLTLGQGALFPKPGAGEWFMATITNAANQMEIVRCDSITADTLQVVRGQEGTSARPLAAGDKIENRLTAAALLAIRDAPADPAQIPDHSIIGRMLSGVNDPAGAAVTTGKIALGAVGTDQIFDGNVTSAKLAGGAALANLGFTPIQQGGGVGQMNNKVFIGWTAAVKLGLQVDNNPNLGYILTERQDGSTGSAGYRSMYPTAQNNDYTLGLVDDGRGIYHNGPGQVYYIPDETTPFQIGAVIHIVNFHGSTGPITIAGAAGVSLIAIPGGSPGNRKLAAPGVATVEKVSANLWYIYGAGLT